MIKIKLIVWDEYEVGNYIRINFHSKLVSDFWEGTKSALWTQQSNAIRSRRLESSSSSHGKPLVWNILHGWFSRTTSFKLKSCPNLWKGKPEWQETCMAGQWIDTNRKGKRGKGGSGASAQLKVIKGCEICWNTTKISNKMEELIWNMSFFIVNGSITHYSDRLVVYHEDFFGN